MRLTLALLIAALPLTALAVEPPLPRPRPEPAPAATSPSPPAAKPADAPVASTPEKPAAPTSQHDQLACPVVLNGSVTAEVLPPIHEGQCAIATPLQISSVLVNGRQVKLNTPSTIDCSLATALPGWLSEVDAYATTTENTGIDTVTIGTSYACRNVDNQPTGKLSYHAFGGALDVMGFTLSDGRSIAVASGYRGSKEQGGAILRFAHESACARFTTVLGPDADSFHQDHIHVDVGCHGRACTARLCQ